MANTQLTQSGAEVQAAIDKAEKLPSVTSADEGKVLKVNSSGNFEAGSAIEAHGGNAVLFANGYYESDYFGYTTPYIYSLIKYGGQNHFQLEHTYTAADSQKSVSLSLHRYVYVGTQYGTNSLNAKFIKTITDNSDPDFPMPPNQGTYDVYDITEGIENHGVAIIMNDHVGDFG